jgi:hypothetical protein
MGCSKALSDNGSSYISDDLAKRLKRTWAASADLPLPPDDKGKISGPVRRRVEKREREGRLPNWCVNINEGTGPSAAI